MKPSSIIFRDEDATGYLGLKILRGAIPGELLVQQSTKFKLVINLKTAKALGPPSRRPSG